MAAMGSLIRLFQIKQAVLPICVQQRTLGILSRTSGMTETHSSSWSAGCGILSRALPAHWSLLPVRTKKRGMEYQPKFLKRKRTHGWLKRISTRGGIEVILRRMLKGRKSLTH
ncbi:hypothetical protein XENTR_v10001582 [Xenopus tropicalis]|uniref:Large ribosomal subunit protein bL34m n=1 Tax=Xenopus tropicalis TaxID=8364 RepID=A0A6I8Q561_XENTR|nr:39S ribosomal protein L34, mitochondrial [Xenopus tropicalis]KAE8632565.1 hypothetical protein XENTR_v10001582 [Xenopus tropicalis]|eukprot:XP_002944481.2 PREDICTED: 39S ribosomal protein L34, mitochondrial [Xenopus tropicalis]